MNPVEVEKQVTAVHEALTVTPAEHKELLAQPLPQPTILSIIAKAVEAGNLEMVSKLMDLQERYERNEARKAFNQALAAFKENPPDIAKNKTVTVPTKSGDSYSYKHATLDRVTGMIGKALAVHGLAATWSTSQSENKIAVTCKLRHKLGHEEPTTLEGPPDTSGFKNPVQEISSTVTLLERYTLLAATGLATRDDTDGLTFGDLDDAINDIRSAVTPEELQQRYNKHYKRAYQAKNQAAMAIIVQEKNEQKAKLNPADKAKFDEFQALCEKKGLNKANRHMLLAKHTTTDAAIAELKGLPDRAENEAQEAQTGKPVAPVTPDSAKETPAEPAKKGREKRGKQAEATGAPKEPSIASPAPTASPAPKEPNWNF